MLRFHYKSICSGRCYQIMAFLLVVGFSHSALAQDSVADKAEIEAQLAEAQRLLEADMANKEETEAKRQDIEERLAARKQREEEILEELKALCEEQDKLNPGSLDGCMAKLNN